jgi:hypothetical protein
VLLIALVLTAIDVANGIKRLVTYVNGVRNGEKLSLRTLWQQVILKREPQGAVGRGAECSRLIIGDSDEMGMEEDLKAHSQQQVGQELSGEDDEEGQWANHFPETPSSERTVFGHRAMGSTDSHHSDDTLHHVELKEPRVKLSSKVTRIGHIVFAVVERTLIFAALAMTMSGIAVYLGGCRGAHVNTCLAHFISACEPHV